MNSWGKEVIIDAGSCNHECICNSVIVETFLSELVQKIDMVAYGDPIILRFGDEDKFGITAIQLIETSNITCHFSEDTNSAYINCFSCKDFDTCIVVDLVKRFFDNKTLELNVLFRQAPQCNNF